MENIHILQLIFMTFSFFIFLKPTSGAEDDCLPVSCGPTEPEVRFPFRIIGVQPARCGFPGFDLFCDKNNLTTILLPSSRSFLVTRISYVTQVIFIDPEFCIPNRIADVNLTNTPFEFSSERSYTFYNCSIQSFGFMYPAVPFPCLSSGNYSVIAVRTGLFSDVNMPISCVEVNEIRVPLRWNGDIRQELELRWFRPDCRACEMEGRACGLKSDDGETNCLGSSRGIGRGARYGLSIGIGVPALVCIIGLVCYTASRVRDYNETHNHSIDLFSIAIVSQPATRTGLELATIESYPKTLLGESCRLPAKDDTTCAICLSDYKSKESLRTIPECNHYFHADCIDEWLKLNATCPVCRNSPKSSSLVTPCSVTTTSASVDSSR